jgi:hypothetical protein
MHNKIRTLLIGTAIAGSLAASPLMAQEESIKVGILQ